MSDSITSQVKDICIWLEDEDPTGFQHLGDAVTKRDVYRIVQYIKKILKENDL